MGPRRSKGIDDDAARWTRGAGNLVPPPGLMNCAKLDRRGSLKDHPAHAHRRSASQIAGFLRMKRRHMRRVDGQPLLIKICMLTFRRPAGLADALCGLQAQVFGSGPRPEISIVIVDNNHVPYAAAIAQTCVPDFPWRLSTVHEPKPGIARARNRALDADPVDVDFIVFMDDDEVPANDWIARLIEAQKTSGAAVVAGPVKPVYPPHTPAWIKKGRFFESADKDDGATITGAATGNVMIASHAVAADDVRFDERLQTIGGEDTVFFNDLHRAGHHMIWAARAVVWERLDLRRARTAWLMKRWMAYGLSYKIMLEREQPAPAVTRYLLLKGLQRCLVGMLTFPPAAVLGLVLGWHIAVKRLKPLCRGVSMVLSVFNLYIGEDKLHGYKTDYRNL